MAIEINEEVRDLKQQLAIILVIEELMTNDCRGFQLPCGIYLRTRVRDETIEGPIPYRWQDVIA